MTRADEAHCRKCVWHIQGFGTRDVACGYSLCYGHQSRVKIHYDRIGKETLEGMTHGVSCTEFLEGNAELKKTLLSEDPSFISDQGWALLAQEQGKLKSMTKKKRNRKCTAPRINKSAFERLRKTYTLREIGDLLGIGQAAVSRIYARGTISREKAARILEEFGVDILEETHEL